MAYKTELIPALQALIDAKTANKNAIAAKGVTVPDNAKFADFPTLIAQISSLGDEVTTATANDIAEGLTAYDNNGTLITGTRDVTTFGWSADRAPFHIEYMPFCFTGANSTFINGYFELDIDIDCIEPVYDHNTILSIGENIADWAGRHIHMYYTISTKTLQINLVSGDNYSRAEIVIGDTHAFHFKIDSNGIYINGTNILSSTYFTDYGIPYQDAFDDIIYLLCWDIGAQEGDIGSVTYSNVKMYSEPFGRSEKKSTAPVYEQMFSQLCTSAQTLTYKATGQSIKFATVRLYGGNSQYTKNIAMVRDGSVIQNKCGGTSTISISGNTISISVNAADIETYGSLTAECLICSK